MKPNSVLFLLGLVASAGRLAAARQPGGGIAPQQEVNLLAFGLIQFSQALRHVHDTTQAKETEIRQVLQRQEEALEQLGAQTEQAARAEEGMKEALRGIQAQMAEQQARTRVTKERLAGLEQEEAELHTKVKRLETRVRSSASGSVTVLQGRAEEHGSILRALLRMLELQRESRNRQDEQLRKLQRKVKRTSSSTANSV